MKITISKSQVETIVLEAIQAGATAIAQQLGAENVAKEVSTLMQTDGENLIQFVTSSSINRYSQNNNDFDHLNKIVTDMEAEIKLLKEVLDDGDCFLM